MRLDRAYDFSFDYIDNRIKIALIIRSFIKMFNLIDTFEIDQINTELRLRLFIFCPHFYPLNELYIQIITVMYIYVNIFFLTV